MKKVADGRVDVGLRFGVLEGVRDMWLGLWNNWLLWWLVHRKPWM